MTYKISWDNSGEHLYETGVDHGVLYLQNESGAYPKGEAWNGLSAVTQSPSGAEANPIYADNIKYLNLYSAEEFGATIEAYYYPDGFAKCNGQAEPETGVFLGQQDRQTFGLCYRTVLGNDILGDTYGYKLHFIYGGKASPSEVNYQTVNDSPEPAAMSWEITTIPVNVSGFKPTSYLEIDSTKVDPANLASLESILYGSQAVEAADATYKPAGSTFASGTTYYTRTGAGTSESPYVYAEATGLTEFASNTDYFVINTPAVTAAAAVEGRLPLPDEIISIIAGD